jgi:uncharacterized membrane protein YccC
VTARLIGTGVGAALALIGYLAWPSWEGEPAQQKLARLFETQAHFGALVLRAYVRPGAVDARTLQAASRTTRQARSDAEASADRLNDEPSRPPMTARLAYSLTGVGRRMAHASLTLQAALESTRVNGTGQVSGVAAAADRFADGIETAAGVVAGSLRSLGAPGDMPPLRELQTALYEQLTGPGQAPPAGPDAVLPGVTDEFTDALDSAAEILHRRLGTTVEEGAAPRAF